MPSVAKRAPLPHLRAASRGHSPARAVPDSPATRAIPARRVAPSGGTPHLFYFAACALLRAVFRLTLRIAQQNGPFVAPPEGCILACNHISHFDPVCLSAITPRPVGWMARREFFRPGWPTWLLRQVRAFSVHRQGVPVSAIREALARLARRQIVGIFPEGQIQTGGESVLRGGAIKRGICLLALRSGRPIVPCVIVGTEKLGAVAPWLPFRRGRLWVIWGEPIWPQTARIHPREARAQMAAELEASFVGLYAQLRARYQLEDSILP